MADNVVKLCMHRNVCSVSINVCSISINVCSISINVCSVSMHRLLRLDAMFAPSRCNVCFILTQYLLPSQCTVYCLLPSQWNYGPMGTQATRNSKASRPCQETICATKSSDLGLTVIFQLFCYPCSSLQLVGPGQHPRCH